MKRGTPHILRFFLLAPVTATLTILFLRGRDPTFLNFHKHSPAEIALSRVIKRVDLNETPFDQAMRELGRLGGVRIELDEAILRMGDDRRRVSFSAENVALGEVLRDLASLGCRQPLACIPQTDHLQIVYARASQEPLFFDEYMFPYAFRPPPDRFGYGSFSFRLTSPATRASLPLLANDNISSLRSLAWPDADDGDRVSYGIDCAQQSFVLQTASGHQRFHDILEALRPTASPDARRALPFGTEVLDFVNGAFRARDSRAAAEALRHVVPVIHIPSQPLDKALASLSAQVGASIAIEDWLGSFPYVDLYQGQDSLAFAIETLLRRASWSGPGFKPDRATIWITPEEDAGCYRLYELRPYLSQFPESERQEKANQIVTAVQRNSRIGSPRFLGSFLVVDGGWFELETAEAELLQVLNAKPEKLGSDSSIR